MIVRELLPKDANQLSTIHIKSFEGFFLTSLGRSFLTEFYDGILSHKEGVGVGLEIDGVISGFAIGTIYEEGFYKRLIIKKGIRLLLRAVLPLVSRPKRIFQLLTNLRGGSRQVFLNSGTLLSICIDPEAQEKGLGKLIIAKFEKSMFESGCSGISLTTDADDNDKVNLFYKSQGYEHMETFAAAGDRKMNLYYKKLI